MHVIENYIISMSGIMNDVVDKKPNDVRKIVFLTGTRADFGKLKSLIKITQESPGYEVHIFVTGMHMNSKYGKTVDEVYKAGFNNIYQFINHQMVEHMDRTLAKTIDGFSHYINEIAPDLIVIHGDRVEALAGAIVGSMNNILVAHIEGGEISGTIDELIRHAVSKMSHVHFVANKTARKRLIQLGELPDSIFILGSPDLDLMNPGLLPDINIVRSYYNIDFEEYGIVLYHPVTTEYKTVREQSRKFVNALIQSGRNYIIIYPNNDLGSLEILTEYKIFENNEKYRIFPSVRFEYFLSLLKNARFIIGNSSAGIREAPYYDVPTIDIGSRQHNRAKLPSIFHCSNETEDILTTINNAIAYEKKETVEFKRYFGAGKSDKTFLELLNSGKIWSINQQKQFQDLG